MKLLLIQNKKNLDLTGLYKWSHVIEFEPPAEVEAADNPHKLPDLNPEFEACLGQIEALRDFDAVVISFWLVDEPIEGDDYAKYFSEDDKIKYSALELAVYIRLSEFAFTHHSPIVIITPCSEDQIILKSPKPFSILSAKFGTHLIDYHTLRWRFENEYDDFGNKISSKILEPGSIIEEAVKNTGREAIAGNFSEFKNRIWVPNEASDNHGIANLWGPYQLAKAAGKKINHPKTLYFRYCLRKVSNWKEEKEQSASKKKLGGFTGKVILIDDHYNKGWKEALEIIFGERNVICSETLTDENLDQIESGKFSLVFLDYRFKENTGSKTGDGLKFLSDIKAKNPVLPVIMFTASNKAWNMDKLYEAGADGYYVKEHPETANDFQFSLENYENFIKTIDRCNEKGKLLKPYWQALQRIKDLFSERIGPVREKTLSDGSESDFRGRISERITMFIGLLKKAYEQTAFDEKAFFYSDYELAFLTLWSVLNELQESIFDKFSNKEFEIEIGNGNCTKTHPNGQKIKYLNGHYRWEYFGKVFIDFDYKATFEDNQVVIDRNKYLLNPIEKSIFKVGLEQNEFSELDKLYPTPKKVKFYQSLFIQIAFILKQLNAPASMLSNLNYRNEFRNFLFLTHGEDANSPVFSKTYVDQRKSLKIKGDPIDFNREIKKLFEIVYFLCTAKEWNHKN